MEWAITLSRPTWSYTSAKTSSIMGFLRTLIVPMPNQHTYLYQRSRQGTPKNVRRHSQGRRHTGTSKTLLLPPHGKTCSRISFTRAVVLLRLLLESPVKTMHFQQCLADNSQSHGGLGIQALASAGIGRIPQTILVATPCLAVQCISLGNIVCCPF